MQVTIGNQAYTFRLSLATADRIKAATKIDLLGDDVTKSLVGLVFDRRQLGEVIWCFAAKQAKELDVARDDFFDALDGDALERGWNAVVEAAISFIPPQRQAAERNSFERMMEAVAEGAAALERVIASEGTDQMIAEAIETAEKQMTATMRSQLDSFASSSPGS